MLVDFGNIKEVKVSPSLQVELFEIDTHVPYLRTLKLDFGVAYMRTYFYIGKLWTNILKFQLEFSAAGISKKTTKLRIAATIIRF